MYNWWKSDEPDMIIRMADADDINFVFKDGHNRIPIGPTERAVFIKDGKIMGIIDQDTIKIADEWTDKKIHTVMWRKEKDWGKVRRFLGKMIGRDGKELKSRTYVETIKRRVLDGYIHVLFVDATVIDLDIPINEADGVFTGDARENLTGKCTIRMEFEPLETPKQMRLLTEDKYFTKRDLVGRLRDEIVSEVLKPSMKGFEADEIYGNREVREAAEMTLLHELKHTFDSWGIGVRKVILNWDTPKRVLDDHELVRKKTEIDKEVAVREMEREKEDRERTYQQRVEMERLDLDIRKREKALGLAREIEVAKLDVADRKSELDNKKKRERIDQAAYMLEIMNLRRREREINMMEMRRKRVEMDMEREWERHRIEMDREEQRAGREIEREYKKNIAELERRTSEQAHAREVAAMTQHHKKEMKERDLEARRIAVDERLTMVETLGRHGGISKGQVDVAAVIGATGDEAAKTRAEAMKTETEGRGELYSASAMGVDGAAGAVMKMSEGTQVNVGEGGGDEGKKDVLAELRELMQMYRDGLLTQEEFGLMKKKLLGK